MTLNLAKTGFANNINIHLMQLGISDFAGLRVRYILAGSLFAIYALSLLLMISPIPAGVLLWKWIKSKMSIGEKRRAWAIKLALIIATIFALAMTAYMVSIMMSVFYPEESLLLDSERHVFPWEKSFYTVTYNPKYWPSYIAQAYAYFVDMYGHPILFFSTLLILTMGSFGTFDLTEDGNYKRFIGCMAILYFVIWTITTFVGYAIYVYPNLRYNLGGGQPQFVELQIDPKDALPMQALGMTVRVQDSTTVFAGPIALWHRSSGFLYGTPVAEPSPDSSRLIAVALDRVQGMRYLSIIARFESGGRIREILTTIPQDSSRVNGP